MQLEQKHVLRMFHLPHLENTSSCQLLIQRKRLTGSYTSRRVRFHYGAKCPVVNLLELENFIKRKHLLLLCKVRAHYHRTTDVEFYEMRGENNDLRYSGEVSVAAYLGSPVSGASFSKRSPCYHRSIADVATPSDHLLAMNFDVTARSQIGVRAEVLLVGRDKLSIDNFAHRAATALLLLVQPSSVSNTISKYPGKGSKHIPTRGVNTTRYKIYVFNAQIVDERHVSALGY
jgi:hypothetical protein